MKLHAICETVLARLPYNDQRDVLDFAQAGCGISCGLEYVCGGYDLSPVSCSAIENRNIGLFRK